MRSLSHFEKDIIRVAVKKMHEERICKNCKWWIGGGRCSNSCVRGFVIGATDPPTPETFGCNEWKGKEE